MTEYVVANGRIYTEDKVVDQGYIRVADGKIAEVGVGNIQVTCKLSRLKEKIFYQVLLIFIFMVVMARMRWTRHLRV